MLVAFLSKFKYSITHHKCREAGSPSLNLALPSRVENTVCFLDNLSLVTGQCGEQRVNSTPMEEPVHPASSQRIGKGDSAWKQVEFLVLLNRKLGKRSKGLMAS